MANIFEKFKAVLTKFGEPIQVEPEIERAEDFREIPVDRSNQPNDWLEGSGGQLHQGPVKPENIDTESYQAGRGTAEAGAGAGIPGFEPGVEAQAPQYRGLGEVKPDSALNNLLERPEPGRESFTGSGQNIKDIHASVGSARGPEFVSGEIANNANPDEFRPLSPVDRLKAKFPHMAGEFSKMSTTELKGLADRFVQKEKEKVEKATKGQVRQQAVAARKQADRVKIEEVRRYAKEKAA